MQTESQAMHNPAYDRTQELRPCTSSLLLCSCLPCALLCSFSANESLDRPRTGRTPVLTIGRLSCHTSMRSANARHTKWLIPTARTRAASLADDGPHPLDGGSTAPTMGLWSSCQALAGENTACQPRPLFVSITSRRLTIDALHQDGTSRWKMMTCPATLTGP